MKALKYFLLWLLLLVPFLFPLFVVWYVFREEMVELGIGLSYIVLIALGVATGLFLLFYVLSWRLLLRWYGAQEVEEGDIFEKAQGVAEEKGVKIRLFTADIGVNALSFGGARKGFVVLSQSLIDLLDSEEVEAVLSHEIGSLKDKHSMVYTIVAFIAGLITSISTLAFWGSLLTGFGQEDDPAPNLIKLFVMSLVAPFAAFLIHLLVPGNWKNIGKDDRVLSVVKKVEGNDIQVNPAHSFLFFVNPLRGEMTTILDFKLPTYKSLFRLGNPENPGFVRLLFYSLISYGFVLFVIVAAETFRIKDFEFLRAAIISAGYIALVIPFLIVLLFLLRLRNRGRHSVQNG